MKMFQAMTETMYLLKTTTKKRGWGVGVKGGGEGGGNMYLQSNVTFK